MHLFKNSIWTAYRSHAPAWETHGWTLRVPNNRRADEYWSFAYFRLTIDHRVSYLNGRLAAGPRPRALPGRNEGENHANDKAARCSRKMTKVIRVERQIMNVTETVIEGTLKPDGTLELDQKPNLPPGRMTIRMQPLTVLPEGDPFFDMLKGIWAVRAQAGLVPRTVEEVEAQRRHLRDESEQELLEAGRLQEESRHLRGNLQQKHAKTGL